MSLVRVGRQGNSTVVTLAQDIPEKIHLNEGDLVRETVDEGRVVLRPFSVQARVLSRVVAATKHA